MSVTEIASRAGVSIATVSRVLNNSRRVSPEVLEQVRKAMDELQYSPRQMRRRTRSANGSRGDKQTGTIAIVSIGQEHRGWFEMPVMAAVVSELSRFAQELHLGVLLADMPDPNVINPVLKRPNVDGALVFIPASVDPEQSRTLRQQLPLVRVMGGQFGVAELDHVTADNHAVGVMAAEHLLEMGCREIAFLTSNPGWETSRLRAQGFAVAAQKAGMLPAMFLVSEDPILAEFYGTRSHARPTLSDLVDDVAARRPAGLFIPRDEETVQVYRLLAEHGIRPGRDIQIVSCDNEDVRLSMLHPRPTSIELNTAEIARQAVLRLITRIKKPDDRPLRIFVRPQLVLAQEEPEPPLPVGNGHNRQE
jgi:LacI family transcriptional regulator